MVVHECTINTAGSGIVAQGNGTEDSYFRDDRVVGATPFENDTLGANGDNVGEGVQITEPGTVICCNYVRDWRPSPANATSRQSEPLVEIPSSLGAVRAFRRRFDRGDRDRAPAVLDARFHFQLQPRCMPLRWSTSPMDSRYQQTAVAPTEG